MELYQCQERQEVLTWPEFGTLPCKPKAAEACSLLQVDRLELGHPFTGVDPKSVVCEYYRQGRCTKGHKCKYSHDLNVERKGGKIDLFTERCCSQFMSPFYCRSVRSLKLGLGHNLLMRGWNSNYTPQLDIACMLPWSIDLPIAKSNVVIQAGLKESRSFLQPGSSKIRRILPN